ncbi:hypothetical protein ACHQM5_030494 [Ranunculus cassubicifolius]
MAGSCDSDLLLSTFDQIYEEFKNGVTEINSLKSSYNAEINRRESLDLTCKSLKQDNERLMKLYSETMNKLANQIERRSKSENLKDELKKLSDEHHCKEQEHKKEMDLLQEQHAVKVGDLETRIRCFLVHQEANEETISQLRGELATHKAHIESLSKRVEQVHANLESKHHQEVQDLKDWLYVEEEEKRELTKKLQLVEEELENSKKQLQDQQRDSTSNRHVETLKQKIMKLRKENEVMKRQFNITKDRY